MLGIIYQRSLIIGIILIILTTVLFIPMEKILIVIGQGDLAAPAAKYLQILIPFSFFDAIFWFSSVYIQAQKLPFIAMAVAFGAALFQIFWLWFFIFE